MPTNCCYESLTHFIFSWRVVRYIINVKWGWLMFQFRKLVLKATQSLQFALVMIGLRDGFPQVWLCFVQWFIPDSFKANLFITNTQSLCRVFFLQKYWQFAKCLKSTVIIQVALCKCRDYNYTKHKISRVTRYGFSYFTYSKSLWCFYQS